MKTENIERAAEMIATELRAIVVDETLARAIEDGDVGALMHQHGRLLKIRLGGDYDAAAEDRAAEMIEEGGHH